jgi:hypothetical protein
VLTIPLRPQLNYHRLSCEILVGWSIRLNTQKYLRIEGRRSTVHNPPGPVAFQLFSMTVATYLVLCDALPGACSQSSCLRPPQE